MNKIKFRSIEQKDLIEVFLLLQQLTQIDYSDRNIEDCWQQFISNNSSNSVVGLFDDKVVAYGSLIIENKIRGEVAGHIEDIVVDKNMRNQDIGFNLIDELVRVGGENGCYRVTLLCKQYLTHFYGKNGFITDGIAMKKYIKL